MRKIAFLKSSLRADRRGQAIHELEKKVNRKIPKIFLQSRKIGMTFICCLLSTTAHAECTPAPNCAELGYTTDRCEDGFVRCPFDTSKLFCIPCDSSYKYDCSGNNIIGGVGSDCNRKYASCECVNGATFNNGSCVCDTSCKTIGNIVYSDKSCSSCVDTTKTAVAVVVHSDDTSFIITPLTAPNISWSSSDTDVTSLANVSSTNFAKEDMNGMGNSQLIREFFSSDDETNNAAWYCHKLEIEGFEDKKGEWYLPAAGEIYNYFYTNYSLINSAFLELGLSSFDKWYWSSSVHPIGAIWYVGSYYGDISHYLKDGTYTVSCILIINK